MRRDEDLSNFEDPALRSAIQRAWSGQTAPPALHRRLADAAASGAAPASRMRWYRHPLLGLAAAAIVLIAVGILTMRMRNVTPTPIPIATTAPTLPESLADALIIRHDACCKLPDHHDPKLPHDDLRQVAIVLKQKLGFPIISAEPSPAPWKFDGAHICEVGTTWGAHLIFKQSDQDVSIYSMPLSIDPQAAGKGEFAMVDDGHPIVGFATQSAFYAVVGSSTDNSLSLASVEAMCDRLRPMVAPGSPPARPAVAAIAW